MVKLTLCLLALLLSDLAFAQNPPVSSPLLDHLAGKWVAEVSIDGQSGVHDVDAEWVLNHRYLRVHEISRERESDGSPQYEATIYIGSRPKTGEIACVWLDVFGGTDLPSIGVATPKDSALPFVFKDNAGDTVFKNEFAFNAKAETWQSTMENVDHGKATAFGTMKLARATTGNR